MYLFQMVKFKVRPEALPDISHPAYAARQEWATDHDCL